MRINCVLMFLPLFLAACGGSGGGGSSTLAPFVKFSALTVPGMTRLNGSSQQSSYTADTSTQRVTSVGAASSPAAGAQMELSFNASRDLTRLAIYSGNGTNAISDSVTPGVQWSAGSSVDGRTLVLSPTLNAPSLGWDYQTFGVWVTGYGSSNGTAGAFSGGAATLEAAIPVSGTATYTGLAGGVYVNDTGQAYLTQAALSASVNFGTQSIGFSTSGTTVTSLVSGSTPNALGALDMTGNLSYTANQFTGTVSTAGGGAAGTALTGTATGRFYGPAAEELGGTFAMTGGGASMLGAFGGKR